nr:hypothetical protein [Bacteroidota bacterium]
MGNNICAQQPYGNDVVTLTAPPPSCSYTSTDWITKYGRINNYIPTSSTPVKTIRVNFNIFQKNNGSGNFQNNVADINRLNAIANKLNDLFQTIQAPSDPWLGVAFIGDSKIRVELANIFFYQNTAICESSNSAGALAAITAASPQRMEQLNIIFTEPITNPGAGGWAYAPTVGMFNQNQLIHTFGKWVGGSNVADMNTARHLAHELAHCFNVMHLYDVGTCCSESCNTTAPDYLIDCFGPPGLAVCPQNAPGGSTCDPFASATDHLCTNNIMSGKDNVDFYISPLQMGRIHWALAVTNARRYLKTCPFNGTAYQINANETWDFDIRMYNSITINAGATLTIRCNVQMADNAKITVKRGARLIVDGGKITSSCSMWKGVEVWGTASKDQLPIANNPDQGYMQLTNGGIIENAVTAISVAKMVSGQPDLSFTGGIVFIENQADIRNCNRGVVFYDYENVNNTNGLILANASTIRNSFFTITGLLNNGLPHDAFIILNGTRGVKIRGNEFKNTGTNYYCTPDRRGAGIRFHDAIGNVEPTYNCNIMPCQILKRNLFTGLYHGVEVLNTNTTRVVNIIDNDFNSVTRAIHIENADMSAIYNNNILNVPQHEFNPCCTCSALGVTQAYAIYIGNTANFICENNTITGTALLGDKPDYGIVVSDCGAVAKSVYNNTITGFEFGSHNQFNNDGSADITDGLLINCNDFTNNDVDINVEGTPGNLGEVGLRQGYCSQNDVTTKARNRFFTNNCNGNENQFRMVNQTAQIVYYGHNEKTQCAACEPKCRDLQVALINCIGEGFTKTTDCPNLANDDGTALPNRIATLTGDINTIYTLFDGNNAPALIALINAMANVTNVKIHCLAIHPL